ncbi:anthocyanidin 3-O-glucosyltransferase 2-like isoform X2 [Rhodamnia argentea]|uniref:Anthocyanidin 3-O-glucosyltransferase 2-like isoform X2 n=1 Tax=Rhodamnia argentea TaxID=178133 RepID=A0ABM3HZ91_9MYRT|nr:anthocyanidin 3-O-glucosyltransferase 2-like isoform X2 [Rhodamnia argentea]
MNSAELVFVPTPGMGHLVSMVEMAKLLVDRDPRLSITILIMKLPFDSELDSYTSTLATSVDAARIRLVHLPCVNTDIEISSGNLQNRFVESNKPHIKRAVADLADRAGSTRRLAAFVMDMFCTTMIDLADEFGVPSYVFFTSSAAFLGLMLHLQSLQDEQHVDITEYNDSAAELDAPSFANPLPAKVLPSVVLTKESVQPFLEHAKRIRVLKGIIVNTFDGLEPHALASLAGLGAPTVYPVGPILNLKRESKKKADGGSRGDDIMEWLDGQLPSSVVFLCFGSRGSFREDQVKEIARALERSGHRFLWSLRQPPSKGKVDVPRDYVDPEEVLPEGFLDRTVGVGKVIGWAPQAAVLAHPAVGGFVSHCGWNSTLESIWFGMTVAAWPLYAEQQSNAFELVVELGLAVEIKMDYVKDFSMETDIVVAAEEIEDGIRKLMEDVESERRKKVKEVSEKSRKALAEGGSSYMSLGHLIEDILSNMP